MEFKIEESDEGFILTIGDTKWVYARLSQVWAKIEKLLDAAKVK